MPSLQDDYRLGVLNHYRLKRKAHRNRMVRQHYRRRVVEMIMSMPLGEDWRLSWLIWATYLAMGGRFHEILPPEEWREWHDTGRSSEKN